jgi:hypothetical protein
MGATAQCSIDSAPAEYTLDGWGNGADSWPSEADLPIVLISRDGPDEEEDAIEQMVIDFGGYFAGT